MTFFSKINLDFVQEKQPQALMITGYGECVETPYRLVLNKDSNLYSVTCLEERNIYQFEKTEMTIEDFIEIYEKEYETEAIIYQTNGSRGLMQALAERETLSSVIEHRDVFPSDAVALIAIGQKSLDIPVSIGGFNISFKEHTSPFYKVNIEMDDSVSDMYSMDIPSIIKQKLKAF